jgi:hypothetical protein
MSNRRNHFVPRKFIQSSSEKKRAFLGGFIVSYANLSSSRCVYEEHRICTIITFITIISTKNTSRKMDTASSYCDRRNHTGKTKKDNATSNI